MGTRYAAKGTEFKRKSNGSFTAIAQVPNIGGPGLARDTIDVSAHGDDFREFVAGLADAGELSLDLRFDPGDAGHVLLRGDLVGGTKGTYQIVFPTSPAVTWEFSGFVTAYEPSADVEGELAGSITIKLTGSPSFSN